MFYTHNMFMYISHPALKFIFWMLYVMNIADVINYILSSFKFGV